MPKGFLLYGLKIILSWLIDIIYFPIWWFSAGWFALGKKLAISVKDEWTAWSAGIWIKNLFVPMYSQRDFASRLISFFVRIIQIIFRLCVWSVIALFMFILWISWPLWPLIIVSQIYFQFLR